MPRYVGLDLHKRVLEVCGIDERGEVLWRERIGVTRDELTRLATERLQPDDRVAVEATTNTWAVVKLLREYVPNIVVSNPVATKYIASSKVKTDKVDALVLAQLLRADYLPTVWQPDPDTARLRSLTHRRTALVQDRTAVKNRIHSILHQRLIHPPVDDLWGTKGQAWLECVELDPDGRAALESDLRLLAGLEHEIELLDTTLIQVAAPDPRVRLLITLPGVDVTCAQTLLSALGDIDRFRDGDHAASYLGLVPSTKQSAEHSYHGSITKAGNTQARWMLVQAAQHVGKHPGPLGVFFRRLARKHHNVAVVATARKLVVIAYLMLKNGEPYRYAQPAPTHEKLRRLRLRAGGARRRTGTKGVKPKAKLPGGSRTIKPLDQIYAEEAVAARRPLRPGEQRMVRAMEVHEFVDGLDRQHVIPRISAPKLGS